MGARAGWCWISVVVMGRRFPVRLSLRSTRCVLQDKRRRVRITGRCSTGVRWSVFLFQFGSIDDLDLAENLCVTGDIMSFVKSAVEYRCEQRKHGSKQRICISLAIYIYVYEMFSIYVHAFFCLKFSCQLVVIGLAKFHICWVKSTSVVKTDIFWKKPTKTGLFLLKAIK